MPEVMEQQDVFLRSFQAREKTLERSGPPWLRRIRQEAMQRFAELGFPTTRDEEWKFTSVAPISKISFQPAVYDASVGSSQRFGRNQFEEEVSGLLTFVNGHYCEGLSSVGNLPGGVKAGSLAAALNGADGRPEEHLARYADFRSHPFAALNTALWQDGAYLEIPQGIVLEKPVHLLFVSTTGDLASVSHPRSLIVAGRDAQATLIESYVGLGEGVCFSNAVTEIVAGENAVMDHYKLQQENEQSFHIATLQVHQDRGANFSSCSISLGGALARNEVNAVLDAEGAECTLNGLYAGGGRQHVDNHTTVDHAQPHGSSRQLYKGILDGHAAGVFNGRIIVRKDAQKTNAIQSNKNLLLSQGAVVNTKPQLEIFADDVRCTHGATIGQIDSEAIFYLRSRGLGQQEARHMLTGAFAADILDRIRPAPLRTRVKEALFAWLSREQSLQEAP